MSRRKIKTRPKRKKPHFFTKDEWMQFTDGRSKSKRRRAKKKVEEAAAKEAEEEEK